MNTNDRDIIHAGQRVLNYLPRCIMVKFENVDWHVDGLPVGVFPLFPVERTWEIGGAKILRKGFTLIPDFANTGFMIQGASLKAAVADCGDVHTTAGLAEMMTSYVILSRVTKADGLLLLRAFNPELFTMGA